MVTWYGHYTFYLTGNVAEVEKYFLGPTGTEIMSHLEGFGRNDGNSFCLPFYYGLSSTHKLRDNTFYFDSISRLARRSPRQEKSVLHN